MYFRIANRQAARLTLCVLALCLTSCESRREDGVTEIEEPTPEVATPESSPESTDTAPVAPELVIAEPAQEVPAPLNLDIPEDVLKEQPSTGFTESSDNRLPDLFKKKQREGTSVSGELLFEEDEKVAVDTINGAKITIKIPTGKKE